MFNNNSAQILTQNTQTYQTRSSTYSTTNNQPTLSVNLTQQSPQQLQQQKQYQDYLHEQEVFKMMGKIYQIAKGEQLGKFITIIENTLQQTNSIMKKAKTADSVSKDPPNNQIKQQIANKYIKIKQKNLQILKGMLNLRKKLMNRMYMEKIIVPLKEVELQKLTQKICLVSNNIQRKLQKFHFKKQMSSHTDKKVFKAASVNTPLRELSSASQILCKQTIKMKEELRLSIDMLKADQF